MQQQINFYQFLEQPIRSSLDRKKFFIWFGSAIIFFGIIQAYLVFQTTYHANLNAKLAENLQSVKQQITAAQLKFGLLTGQVEAVKGSPCKMKFSQYLEAIAKASLPGMWLTAINITDKGLEINLIGKSLQATQTQEFINALKKQAIFANFNFELGGLTGISKTNQTAETISEAFNFSILGKAK